MAALHPDEAQLALYSGDDLGPWERWKIRRHLSGCSQCRQEMQAFHQVTEEVREVGMQMPGQVNWPRLSPEMTGNIRVGLAAGECIAGFEKTIRPLKPRLILHAVMVVAAVSLVALLALALNLPRDQRNQLMANLNRVRWERIFTPVRGAPPENSVVVESNPLSVDVRSNGNTLSLMHPTSFGTTVSLTTEDSAGVRYVDGDTGQVTINRVYYAQ